MRFTLFLFLILLSSCFGLIDNGSDSIIENYEVAWIDLREQQFICKRDEESSSSCSVLVYEYVFSVGHNDDFIIAKQHPTSGFENGFKIDKAITNYFIINIKKSNNNVIGPLTQKEFTEHCKKLKIEEIKFDMNYPEIP